MTIDRDDPRLQVPGPPGGERYLCPVPDCLWFFDVPAPEVDLPDLRAVPADGVYRLTVTEVPLAAIEAACAEHLRSHDPGELSSAVRAELDAYSR